MKKLIACALALVLCLSLFAGCNTEKPVETNPNTTAPAETQPAVNGLENARAYLRTMYKDQPETTPTDYTVVGVLNINGVEYQIDWTADSDTIVFTRGEDKMVTVDVDEENPEELLYNLTATITDGTNTETISFPHKVPAAIILDAAMSYAEIVDLAYTLEDGMTMDGPFRLYGTVTSIDTAWSEDYQNITVTIAVAGKEDMPIQCYRLAGEGAKDLAVGDDITVEGSFKNYKGTYEFDQGCVLVGYGEHVDQSATLEAAYALEDGLAMPTPTVLTGTVVRVDTAWSEDYQNITVTMDCGDPEMLIQCYRLSGEGAKELAEGSVITVFGTIKNYKGTIEFDQGCVIIPAEAAASLKVAVAAYGLEEGLAMTSESTMTGTIVSIDTAYSADYKNITVTIVAGGVEDYKIQCYRLAGEGAEALAVGDVITVTGTMKNYKGTIEFDAGCQLVSVTKAG